MVNSVINFNWTVKQISMCSNFYFSSCLSFKKWERDINLSMHTIIVISEIKEAGFQSAIPVVIKLYPLCYAKLKTVIHSCLKTIEWFCYFHSQKMKRIRTAREALQERMKKASKTAWHQLTVWKFVGMFTQTIQTTRIYYLVRLTYRKANVVMEIHSLHLLLQPLLQKRLLDRGFGQSHKPTEITEVCGLFSNPENIYL